jgi:hypothetical protein|tara:strand:+ start:188 stop:1099 length:912 start_codon:yes stop_codon:yes gene_type:complete
MKSLKDTLALAATCAMTLGTAAHGTVLEAFPGPFTDNATTADPVIVDTATATGNWLDGYDDATDVGTLYFSFEVTVDNNAGETGAGGFFAGLEFIGVGEDLSIGNWWQSTQWGGYRFSGDFNLQPDDATTEITSGSSATIAGKIVLGAGLDDDTVTLWLNPTAGAEVDQPASITTFLSGADTPFDTLQVRSGNSTPPATSDGQSTYSNIVFATEFSDVVDPGTSLQLTITEIVSNVDDTVTLTWKSDPTPGTTYKVLFNPDLSAPKSEWSDDNDSVATQGDTTIYTTDGSFAEDRMFFVVEKN